MVVWLLTCWKIALFKLASIELFYRSNFKLGVLLQVCKCPGMSSKDFGFESHVIRKHLVVIFRNSVRFCEQASYVATPSFL